MNVLVEYGMMQNSVDPIYAVIGGQEEAKKVRKTLAFSLDCRRNIIHTMEWRRRDTANRTRRHSYTISSIP